MCLAYDLTLIITIHGGSLIVADNKTGSEWLHGALNKVFPTNNICRRQIDILHVLPSMLIFKQEL